MMTRARRQGQRRRTLRASLTTTCLWGAVTLGSARGIDVPWAELRVAELRLREVREQRAVVQEAIDVLGKHTDWGSGLTVVTAVCRVDQAEAAYAKLREEADLAEIIRLRDEAEKACGDTIESKVVGDEPAYAALIAAIEQAQKERDALDARGTLSLDEAKKLAALRIRTARLEQIRAAQVKALWTHDAGKEVAKACAERRAKWQEAHAKDTPAGNALAELEAARKDLTAVYESELASTEAGQALLAEREALDRERGELQARIAKLYRDHAGHTGAWKLVETAFDLPPGGDGKSPGQVKVRLWSLPETRLIRGLIVRALDHPLLLMVAADCDLAFIDVQPPRGVDVRDGEPSLFDQALAKAAEVSGHPEVAYLPFLAKGTSAGVLGARNMGFWRPDRCLGVVHHAGGNLHHARRSPPRQMPHVPFLAINGEFERFGPEGGGHSSGIHGIRGDYGKQTQWVMCREQLLRMRRQNPDHLISMLVQPRGDHATWDEEMWWITAMFARKAAQARIPKMEKPPTKEVLCVPLKPSDGWLSDARLDHPRYPHAPYADYKGDKIEAFWHLDQEMADAVAAYHEGEFYLPDLSLRHPVPADWGVPK